MGAGEAACDLLMTSRLRSAAVADVGALQRRTAAIQIHLAFHFSNIEPFLDKLSIFSFFHELGSVTV